MSADELICGLPGEALVREGAADLKAGRRTISRCLVEIARTRLTRAGVLSVEGAPNSAEPELELYRLLRGEGGDSYSRYNSLVRELVSFENALDFKNRKQKATLKAES